MKIRVDGERSIRLESGGEELEIVAPAPGPGFSPLHMLAASLATCTLAVLNGWAAAAGLETAGLQLAVAWDYDEEPRRVRAFRLDLTWPGLPAERRAAALRAAHHCTVEATLVRATPVHVNLEP
jgi:uncharacterized OsmC-like protein